MEPRFLSLADVAETLNLSVQGVRSLVRTGELEAIQVGGRKIWRVERSKLEEYIATRYAEQAELRAEQTA